MDKQYPILIPRILYDEIRHWANLERIPLNKMAARIVLLLLRSVQVGE